VAEAADRLVEVLYDADRRGFDHWAREGYGEFDEPQRLRVARVLAEAAAAGDAEQLRKYVIAFTSNARALLQILRDLAVLFTYDDSLRPALPTVWREVMTTSLDALQAGADLFGDRYWSDDALAGLIPAPQIGVADTDPNATLERADRGWLSPEEIAELVDRWLPFARRQPKAIDAVVRLAKSANATWQATTGLLWVEDLIDGDYAAVAGKCWYLTDWLESVRMAQQLDPKAATLWRRVVDGLAAEGDSRAVQLQQAEE
jgi:hypothetical protein